MTFKELRDIVEKDFAVMVLGTLYLVIKVVDRFTNDNTLSDIKYYSIKTKNYHVRLLADRPYGESMLLTKPKGFFKEWRAISQDDLPKFLADEIFDDACPKDRRKKLVSKVMELKAFW